MKNYFAKLRENEEKGFSLVELIIVMAIMAILVGVVASQVIPYMEKSRQAKDQQQISGMATDITASIASAAVTVKSTSDAVLSEAAIKNLAQNASDGDKIVEEFVSLRSTSTVSDAVTAVSDKLKSKAAKDAGYKIYMGYDATTSKLTLYMTKNGGALSASNPKINKLTVETE